MGLAVKEGLNKLGNGARARMAHSNGWGLLLLLLLGCAYPLAGNAEEIIRDQHERELHLNINPHFGETERAAIREWIEYLSHSLTLVLSLIHISEPTRPPSTSRMPSSA